MNLGEAIALVQQGLGFRTDLADQIEDALAAAQEEFEGANRTLPKFLIQEDQTLNVLAATQNITLPTGFIKEVEDEGPNYAGTDSRVYLRKLTKREAEEYYFDAEPGQPEAYVIRNSVLRVYPEPDTAYTLTWSYYKKETFPGTTSGTNQWFERWPRLLVGRAGLELARDTRQTGVGSPYERFSELFTIWNTKWMASIAAEEDANMPRAMGLNN